MEKKQYTAPELTVVNFKAERGYQTSGYGLTQIVNVMVGSVNVPSIQENWTEDNTTFAGDWTTNN